MSLVYPKKMSTSSYEKGGGGGTALNFGSAIADFFAGILAFLSGVAAGLASLFSALPWLIFAIVVTLLMVPWVQYHDEIIEEVEHAMRGVVYPAWRDVGVPIANFIRSIWNPLICWWNAANWWFYGIIREVIYPTLLDCNNLKAVFVSLGEFVLAVLKDFVVDYFFAMEFYNGPADFTNICNKWIAFWNEWMTLYSCACNDLSILMMDLPIIPSVFFSAQWADPQTWCAVSNLVNAASEMFGVLLKLVTQLLQAILSLIAPQSPYAALNFTRPNFYKAFHLSCQSAKCLSRSTENAIQRFWNDFVPFYFNFTDFFSPLDVAFCLIVKTINWFLTVLVHIDQVVVFPSNSFWETTMKPLTIENLNIFAPPTAWAPVVTPPLPDPQHYTMTNYYLNTSSPSTPTGGPNPVYQQKRMTEAVCVVITRIVCDATGGFIPCFSSQTGNILQGFDFCCGTDVLGTLIVDAVSTLVELSYHMVAQSGQDFFLFLDQQPFLKVFVDDLVRLARCLLSWLRLIPVVGRALENMLVEAAQYLFSMIRFIIQTVLGLATLPFFIIELDGAPNFITTTNRALDEFVAIQERMVGLFPESFVNSLCIVLNSGFPIPPIPCGSCNVGGFIPLPPLAQKRKRRTFVDPETGEVTSPWDLAAESFGWKSPKTAYLVTPLLYYDTPESGFTRMNPLDALKRIMENKEKIAGFSTHEEVDRFVDEKKAQLLKRWTSVVTCADLKREEAELRETRPHIYRYNKQNGKYDCSMEQEQKDIKKIVQQESAIGERLTLGPTIPPLASCSNPTPECFDLCCLFRVATQFIIQTLSFAARFFNGFVQYEASRQGTARDFPYFTGEFCEPQHNKPCFESDLVDTLLLAFQLPACLCRFLNLVIPISVDNPRPDICCFIQRVAELVVCLIMVIINAVNSLVLGQFDYFRAGLFFNDVSTLFDVALEFSVCMCNLVRAIFPIDYIPALKNAISFDVCCAPMALFDAAVELIRLAILTIISLATITITPTSYCFFRLDNDNMHACGGTLDNIGIVQRADAFLDRFLPISDVNVVPQTLSCSLTCAQAGAPGAADQGIGGLIPCVCQLFNTLIPWRANPGLKVSCDAANPNCQNINLCCPLVKLGIAMNAGTKFVIRALVAIWQPWNGLPEFFVNFVFCDETASQVQADCGTTIGGGNACAYTWNGVPTPHCQCGTFTCGQTNIVIDHITALVSACLCEFVRLLDALIKMLFESLGTQWPDCFCGQNGILQSAAKVVNIVTKQIINSIRKSPLPCFWNPSGYSQLFIGNTPVAANTCVPGVDPGCNCKWIKAPVSHVEDSWIYSVAGPVADAMCQSIGNFVCILNSLFFINPACLKTGSLFLGSTVRWGFQFAFVVGSFIEGFIRQFTDPDSTCVGADHGCFQKGTNVVFQGIQSKPLAKLLVALISFPFDMMIGDRTVACSGICPRGISLDFFKFCDCWKTSPQTAATYDCGGGQQCSVWDYGVFFGNLDPKCNRLGLSDPNNINRFGCRITNAPQHGNVVNVLTLQGMNCVIGVGAVLPFCENIEDKLIALYNYYVSIGTCVNYDMNNCFLKVGVNPGTQQATCSAYGLCRPDQLPSCGNSAVTDIEQATIYKGPIDGIIMGLFRYINCAIPGNILYPLLWFLSIIWQLLGAFIYFVVTLIFFIISLFTTSGGCACYDAPDEVYCGAVRRHTKVALLCYPCKDANAMCGNAPTEALRSILLCEPHCPFKFGTNPSNATEVAAAQAACVSRLTSCSKPTYLPASAAAMCSGAYTAQIAQSRCTGLGLAIGGGTLPACLAYWTAFEYITEYGQSGCAAPYCQVGGTGIVPNAGILRDDKTGSSYPGEPLGDCFFKNLFDGFGQVINAFVAIFTTPLIAPAAYKRDMNFKESRTQFWKRAGINQKNDPVKEFARSLKRDIPADQVGYEYSKYMRIENQLQRAVDAGMNGTDIDSALRASSDILPDHLRRVLVRVQELRLKKSTFEHDTELTRLIVEAERYVPVTQSGYVPNQPSTPELIMMALYEYDTTDCFTDPVACVCRNFVIPELCTWTPEQGTIPNQFRKKRFFGMENTTKYAARNEVIYPEEVMSVLTNSFTDSTSCDHNIKMCSMMSYDSISSTTMEKWVSCVDKRIQGERLSDISDGVITPNIMYYTQAPLNIFHNIVSNIKESAQKRRDHVIKVRSAERKQTKEEYPDMWKTLEDRAILGRRVLVEKMGLQPDSPIIEGIVEMDSMIYKYQTGYYKSIFLRAWNSMSGFQWPTPEEAFLDLHDATLQLVSVVRSIHFRQGIEEAVKQTRVVYGWMTDVLFEQGLTEYARSYVDSYKKRRRDHIEATKEERDALWAAWNEMPLVKYFKAPPSNVTSVRYTIFDHLSAVIKYRRSLPKQERGEFEFWTADLRVRDAIDHIFTPKWTDQMLDNWRAVGRVGFRIYNAMFPGQLSHELQNRVFINGNCRIVDKSLDLTLKLVDYCANEWVPNVNFRRASYIVDYLNATSPHREGTFYNKHNIKDYVFERTILHDPDSWIRPKFNASYLDVHQRNTRRVAQVDRNAYKRAVNANTGPAHFNFYAWFVSVVESIISWMFNANASGWWNDAKAWIKNPNTDEASWPDVGLRYWLLFFVRCQWPDNLNCAKGLGLKTALLWVTIGVLAALLVGALILPPIMWLFSFVPAAIFWIVLVGVVGFHYSPSCFIMFPSLTGIGFSLPMCLADELKDLGDTIFRSCYAPVPIPPSMISGDVCPVDPNAYIDFVNCAIVGVSDGIQNVLFLGIVLIGDWFYDITLMLAQSTIAMIIPGAGDYMRTTLDSFRFANPTQRERQWICFGLTAPSMVIILLGFTLVFIALGFVIPLLIMLIMKGWYLVVASPVGGVLPGGDDEAWDETYEDPDEKRDAQNPDEEDMSLEDIQAWIQERKNK